MPKCVIQIQNAYQSLSLLYIVTVKNLVVFDSHVIVSWLCEEIETGFGFLILFCGAHIMILIELVFSIVSRGNCLITSHLN